MHNLHSPRSRQVLRLKGPKSERPLGVEGSDCPLTTPPFFSGSKTSLYWGSEERKGGKSAFVGCVCHLGFSLCFTELALTAVISHWSWLPSFPPWALLCDRWVWGRFFWWGVGGEGYAHLRAPTGPSAHPTKAGASGPKAASSFPLPVRPLPFVIKSPSPVDAVCRGEHGCLRASIVSSRPQQSLVLT